MITIQTTSRWRVMYIALAKLLPQSTCCKLIKFCSCFFMKQHCDRFGKNLEIDRTAMFSLFCLAGGSGIGSRCELCGEVRILNKVPMVPNYVFYTKNTKTVGLTFL